MESWFWLAIGSALFGGFQVFTYKVAAERNYDAALVNTYAAVISAVLLFCASLYGSGSFYLSQYIYILIFLTAVVFMWGNIARHEALKCIDATLYFPIYKVVGPILAIIAGILIFRENFSTIEWFGLILSLTVPLLLISNAEKGRQKNLARGIKLLLLTSLLSGASALLSKEMAITTENIWFLIAVGDSMLAVVGVAIFLYRNRHEDIKRRILEHSVRPMLILAFWLGVLQAVSFAFLMFAYQSGPMGIVFTINSLYILIPIILSILYYNEHWNVRKVVAVILSIVALALLK